MDKKRFALIVVGLLLIGTYVGATTARDQFKAGSFDSTATDSLVLFGQAGSGDFLDFLDGTSAAGTLRGRIELISTVCNLAGINGIYMNYTNAGGDLGNGASLILFDEVSSDPFTPPTGFNTLYFKGGSPYWLDDEGASHQVGSASADMTKAVYDTDNNGIVDDADMLYSNSDVSATEYGYLDGVTSAIQTQFANLWNNIYGIIEELYALIFKNRGRITVTITKPLDLDEADFLPIWRNTTGAVFTITDIYATAPADNTDFTLKHSASGTDFTLSTIKAVSITNDGTGCYYVQYASGDITDTTIPDGALIGVDNDATDDPNWISFTIKGQ